MGFGLKKQDFTVFSSQRLHTALYQSTAIEQAHSASGLVLTISGHPSSVYKALEEADRDESER